MTVIGAEPNISQDLFLKTIRKISDSKTVGELLLNRQKTFSYTALSYHLLPPIGSLEYDAKGIYWTDSLPTPIKNYYDSFDGKPDPTIDYILSKGCPYWLSELGANEDFSDDRFTHLINTTINLTGDSLVMPLYGPFHKRAGVFLSFEKSRDFFHECFKWQVHALVQAAHVKYCLMTNSIRTAVKLTNRESEVLELITFGKTNPEIGKILGISTSTVAGYVKQIFLKLDVSDRVTAALRARSFTP